MSSEKTEPASQQKLKDERKKGNVPSSKDFSKATVFVAFIVYLATAGRHLFDHAAGLIEWSGEHATEPFRVTLTALVELAMEEFFVALAPFVLIIFLVGSLSEFLQHGPVFAPDKIKPKAENIFGMIKKIQQWFALRNLVEFCKSILKVVLLSCALWWLVWDNMHGILLAPDGGELNVINVTGKLIMALFIMTAIIFAVFALTDLLLQRLLFMREQKMSKDDVHRELKDTEGDPHFKQHRKNLYKEIVGGTSKQAVKNSTAVVTNPTHLAVALRYVPGETPLPIVMAKGAGELAAMIVSEARDSQIPVVQNIPLARALMADADVDDYIPDHLIEGVAELLRAIFEASPTAVT